MSELPAFITCLSPYRSHFHRKGIAGLAGGAYRVVAPDLIGLGLSDKPRELSAHTPRRHGESLLQFVQELELQDIVLVLQGWGGPIGAWMAARPAG